MELGLREWLIIGGAIVVVLIVLDGWRRMRGGANNLKMKIDQTMVDLPEEDYNPELPGGGARVVDHNGNPVEQRKEPTLDDFAAVKNAAAAKDDTPLFTEGAETLSAPRMVSEPEQPPTEPLTSEPQPSPVIQDAPVSHDRDPLFEPLHHPESNDSEPLAHLDEGISAVRVVASADPEPVEISSDQVPLVDTIVRSAPASAEPDGPQPEHGGDPLFDSIDSDEAVEDEEDISLLQDDLQPEHEPGGPSESVEPAVVNEDESQEEVPPEIVESSAETNEPALDSEDDDAVFTEMDDQLSTAIPAEDESAKDEVIVEDDVLDLTFLHQQESEESESAESDSEPVQASSLTETDTSAETESPVVEINETESETQAELNFVEEDPYHAEEDDLIASLPEGFSIPASDQLTAEDHDEPELDLSRPITELMHPETPAPEPQQTAMELVSEETSGGEMRIQDEPVAESSDFELHEHFSAEREPELTDSELSAIAAVDEPHIYADNLLEKDQPVAELVTPALQVKPKQSVQEPEPQPRVEGKSIQKVPEAEKVLVISVVAPKDRPAFSGRSLLQILMACGMRYGDMKIFHRYEDGIDQGAVQFSMANAVEPGYFDIDSMEQTETRGVTFFMSMEEPRDVMNAYECMLGTAEAVANNLHGNLLDENRSTMRSQTKEHYRERIRRFEMRKLKQSSGA